MPRHSPLDYIDYTSLHFPSDRITLLDVRRAHPDRFDVEDGRQFSDPEGKGDFRLAPLVYLERIIARAAFEAALGKPSDLYAERGLERAGCVEEVAELYRMYGVSTGLQHTQQLVRDLETQAAKQAKGRRP
ncbi:MAG TPA: hypothetical protein VH092_14055 [Urbifossiella sp.]|jgi:hypothetical protein|nr:hypothetical protein [Urbifossiella sp.]